MSRRIALSSLSLALLVAAASATPATAEASPRSIGVMFDAGVPDGLTGSLVYRPFRPFHLHAGVGTNLISYGVRAGASVYLLPTWISPSINAEAGHYFEGDANATANRFGLSSDSDNPILREVGYNYGNLHVGLDVGRDRCSFFFHAGFSTVRGKLRNIDEMVEEDAAEELTVEVPQPATVTLVGPSARLGFLYYF